jgi:hypothetical protein
MSRSIDKTKKSNIKCEHCIYADKPTEPNQQYWCALHQKEKHYWNRCKDFDWKYEVSEC